MEEGAHGEEHADNYGGALIGRAPDGVRNVSGAAGPQAPGYGRKASTTLNDPFPPIA